MKKSLLIISTTICSIFSMLMSEVVVELGTVDNNSGTIEILINTDSDFMGFQLDVNGVDLTGGNGGIAGENGFSVYASGNTALGFSLDGNVIPAGSNGILTILEGTINADVTDVCLPFVSNVGPEDDTPILSDAAGDALSNISVGSGICLLSNDEEITFSLLKTYPNPFNPELNIDVAIEYSGQLDVSIYNLNGQHIQTIYNDAAVAHNVYNLKWNASAMSSGIYIVQVDTPTGKYSNIVNLLK